MATYVPRAHQFGQGYRDGTQCLYCDGDTFARGLCKMHYQRWYRQGDPLRKMTGNRYGVFEVGREDDGDLLRPGFWDQVDAATRERLSA